MTTFAPTFTPRYKATYVAAGVQHSLTVRGPRGSLFASMEANRIYIGQCFDALAATMAVDLAWISAAVALTDSDVFTPALTPPVTTAGTIAVNLYTATQKITALTWSGKSIGGKSRFSIFGCRFLQDAVGTAAANGVITLAEFAAVGTIKGIADVRFGASDGNTAVYRSVATIKPNDHLLKLVRRGTIT